LDFATVIFLLCPIPNLENQVPVFMCPSDRVAHLYHQALGSLSITLYNTQGYSGGILTLLHVGNKEIRKVKRSPWRRYYQGITDIPGSV
jgi:hypothetical protein